MSQETTRYGTAPKLPAEIWVSASQVQFIPQENTYLYVSANKMVDDDTKYLLATTELEAAKDWSQLAAIATPEKWREMYRHYCDLLTQQDAAGWLAEQGGIALSQLEAAREMRWIPVEERLPECEHTYDCLIFVPTGPGVIRLATYYFKPNLDQWVFSSDRVVYHPSHWMSLPQIPQP